MNHDVIDQDGVLIDLDAVQDLLSALPNSATAELASTTSTALAVPAEPLQLMHTQTLPSKVKDWYASGEGVIVTGAGVALGLASTTAYLMYLDVMTAVAQATALATTVAAHVSAILGSLALLMLVVLFGRRSAFTTVVLKGCSKGPTPGAIRLRIPK